MRVVLAGATGMRSGGRVQACLEDKGIEAVRPPANHLGEAATVSPDRIPFLSHFQPRPVKDTQ